MSTHEQNQGDGRKPPYLWRPHPWHGLPVGPDPPSVVGAYIEITPFDLVKYEIDKESGHLRVDRPQRSSSLPPSLYGFIPRTLCGPASARRSDGAETGDGDPLDVCVISEQPVSRAEVIIEARVVGGIRTLDHGLADDKIIAVLEKDAVWGHARELSDVPRGLIDRLRHYFATYKVVPGEQNAVRMRGEFGREEAFAVIRASMEDYAREYDRS